MLKKILVIKHGALGDIVLSTGPMAAIRAAHPDAEITLLTTPAYAPMLDASGYFNHITLDMRPKFWQIFEWRRLIRFFREGGFDRVYDLQTSRRSSGYHRFFPEGTEWIGTAEKASHRHDADERTSQHTLERQAALLALAGIRNVPPPDVRWLEGDITSYTLPARYALLVPGGSAHRTEKRWPAAHFIALGTWLAEKNITCLLVGTRAEEKLLSEIERAVPHAINLCRRTDFGQIASLARGALLAAGNDTGPMHLIAGAGCPSLVLFSHVSDPALCAPRGERVHILRAEKMESLLPVQALEIVQAYC